MNYFDYLIQVLTDIFTSPAWGYLTVITMAILGVAALIAVVVGFVFMLTLSGYYAWLMPGGIILAIVFFSLAGWFNVYVFQLNNN